MLHQSQDAEIEAQLHPDIPGIMVNPEFVPPLESDDYLSNQQPYTFDEH